MRQSQLWRNVIKNPDLDELPTDLLRNYRVCQLHFSESSYTITSIRRILRNDAVSELLLNLTSSTQTNINKNSTESLIRVELKEALLDVGTTESPKTSGEGKDSSADLNEDNDDGSLSEKDIVREGIHNSSCSTPKTSKQRAILGSVTRKKDLTPVAARLHGIATNLLKRQSKYVHKLGSFKKRLESAEQFSKGVEMKKLQSLSKEQLAFVQMQIRNVHKKAKASIQCDPSCIFH